MRVSLLGLVLFLSAGCVDAPDDDAPAASGDGKGDVWGADDRIERYQIESAPLQAAAAHSVALTALDTLVHDAALDTWAAKEPRTLGAAFHLCEGERFAQQPVISECSGTLVGDDLVLTAGHCFDSMTCDNLAITFDYAYLSRPTDLSSLARGIPGADVYRCAEVIASEHAVDYETRRGADFALIRLDRKVTGRTPAQVNWAAPVEAGRPAYVIGQPSGLPQKLSTGAILDGATNPDFLIHDADVFGGNSGGGMFDAAGQLIGIHVNSSAERYTQTDDLCYVVAVCEDNATCRYKPHAYKPSALAARLAPDVRALLGVPTN